MTASLSDDHPSVTTQRRDNLRVVERRNFGHTTSSCTSRSSLPSEIVVDWFEVEFDCLSKVGYRAVRSIPLTHASRKSGHIRRVAAFFARLENDLQLHVRRLQSQPRLYLSGFTVSGASSRPTRATTRATSSRGCERCTRRPPRAAHDGRRSAIDARTTRHRSDTISQQKRKLVEQGFGWMKTVGGLRKLHHRGGPLVTLDLHLHCGGVQPRANASAAAAGDCVTAMRRPALGRLSRWMAAAGPKASPKGT